MGSASLFLFALRDALEPSDFKGVNTSAGFVTDV
jgi:hypothetical protein